MGRPAVVPPAGKGRGLDARPCRGAFSESAGVGADREDSIPTGRWAAQRAAKAGKGGRLGDRIGPTWGTPVRGGLLVGNCVLLARCPHLYDSDYFPQGKNNCR